MPRLHRNEKTINKLKVDKKVLLRWVRQGLADDEDASETNDEVVTDASGINSDDDVLSEGEL